MPLGDQSQSALIAGGFAFLSAAATWLATKGHNKGQLSNEQDRTQIERDRAAVEKLRADNEKIRADLEVERAEQARRDAEAARTKAAAQREKEQREQHLYEALTYLAGGSQKRSVGVAIVQNYWQEVPELNGMLRPVLNNQALYLLQVSKEVQDLHELDNLTRIMCLVLDGNEDPKISKYYRDLREAVSKRIGAIPERQTERTFNDKLRGIEVNKNVLLEWRTALDV